MLYIQDSSLYPRQNGTCFPFPAPQKRPNAPVRLFFPAAQHFERKKPQSPPATKSQNYPLREKLLNFKITPCVKSGCLRFPFLLWWVYPLCTIIHLCIIIPCATRWQRMVNMYKNDGWFLRKIDSVKHFPLHPIRKSVAAIFSRDDKEYDEVDEGAKEAEETGACWAFCGGRSFAGLGFSGLFGGWIFCGFAAVSFVKKSEQIGVKTRVLVVHFVPPLRTCRNYRLWLVRGSPR